MPQRSISIVNDHEGVEDGDQPEDHSRNKEEEEADDGEDTDQRADDKSVNPFLCQEQCQGWRE